MIWISAPGRSRLKFAFGYALVNRFQLQVDALTFVIHLDAPNFTGRQCGLEFNVVGPLAW